MKKETIKKITIPEQVFNFLKHKNVAMTKKQICEQMNLKKNSVDRACTILRKEKKAGYMRTGWGRFGNQIVKVYWGLKD